MTASSGSWWNSRTLDRHSGQREGSEEDRGQAWDHRDSREGKDRDDRDGRWSRPGGAPQVEEGPGMVGCRAGQRGAS